MVTDTPDAPEPQTDEQPDQGPGGVDADPSESDVGAASSSTPVTPDGPLSAQQDQVEVPDALGAERNSEPAADDGPAEDGASEPA